MNNRCLFILQYKSFYLSL